MPRWQRRDGHPVLSDVSTTTTARTIYTGAGKYYGLVYTGSGAGNTLEVRDGTDGTVLHSVAAGTNPSPQRLSGGFLTFSTSLRIQFTGTITTANYTVFYEIGD